MVSLLKTTMLGACWASLHVDKVWANTSMWLILQHSQIQMLHTSTSQSSLLCSYTSGEIRSWQSYSERSSKQHRWQKRRHTKSTSTHANEIFKTPTTWKHGQEVQKKRFISLIIHRTALCNLKLNPSSRCFAIHMLKCDEDVSGFVCSTRWWNAAMASSSCPEVQDRHHHRANYSRWEVRPRAAGRGDLLELSAVWDGDPLGSPPRPGTQSLHFLDHIHPVLHAAEDDVPTIQPKWTEEINIPPPNSDIIH